MSVLSAHLRRPSATTIVIAVLALTLIVLLVAGVDTAFAAEGGTENGGIGKAFGEILQEWAKYLIPGAAAIVGVPLLARAEVGPAIMVFFLACLLGTFAFMSPSQFKSLVDPILNSLSR